MTKAADKITVEVLKAYSDLPPTLRRKAGEDVLVLMVRIYASISISRRWINRLTIGGMEEI